MNQLNSGKKVHRLGLQVRMLPDTPTSVIARCCSYKQHFRYIFTRPYY
jgi:hypothetical protein